MGRPLQSVRRSLPSRLFTPAVPAGDSSSRYRSPWMLKFPQAAKQVSISFVNRAKIVPNGLTWANEKIIDREHRRTMPRACIIRLVPHPLVSTDILRLWERDGERRYRHTPHVKRSSSSYALTSFCAPLHGKPQRNKSTRLYSLKIFLWANRLT